MSYWIDLFTGKSWEEFRKAGGTVSGFRENQRARAKRIEPGDVFLCYVKGVSRWVGALEVKSGPFEDNTPIFSDDVFPIRFRVKPIVLLDTLNAVPIHEILGDLTWEKATWSGHVRGSPARIGKEDGDVILAALKEAEANPVERPFDPRKLTGIKAYPVKSRKGQKTTETLVTVPERDETEQEEAGLPDHARIQGLLLDLGAKMGLGLWVARNDRGRACQSLGTLANRLLDRLPTQFDEATTRTIEMIDVLWLKGNSIVAAFEIEHTTSIYSGLLRMSDLLAMQPNLDIQFYLVAPDDRREKVLKEIARPTFSFQRKPLHTLCRFLPYSQLEGAARQYKAVAQHLKPEFLNDISEDCSPEE